ncbi:hypothetical protein M422DRAFT_49248 [Sphaerobolus stellatus SS14]|uniref:Unplaced genomic scaffold SPHSTscaffold_70, whole genome shotgun sequence n=1 Tax=Sphaerobolus stellatus (strain SS14) TaxID=990650 RepID=A0A0C9UZR0_SPHS4|nr:hypothetical protein M422DRAFT_49248 [Sphaerobolus stellatus SS14]
MATESSLAALATAAASSSDAYLEPASEPSTSQLKRHYIRTLHKVIDQSDVVILILDARDPEGCRSKLVEDEVRRRESEGKRLVFALNKIDLVPQENATAWLRYLRHTAPTLPFRSSTQHQSNNISSRSSPALINLIKSYKSSPAGRITVGVVGYPNVGKSSLINSLKRSKVCPVAAEPGWTKDLQTVQIDRGIRIIDSPGVVFDDISPETKGTGILLRNVVKVEEIDDPLAVVEEIVSRTPHETLQRIYNLPAWSGANIIDFLTMIALSTGRLLKGGTPDLTSTARQILVDWNTNKIPYFSVPPLIHPSSVPNLDVPGAENVGEAMIVGAFGEAFDVAGGGDEDMGGEEGEGMDEDGVPMDSDDPLRHIIPSKRSHSLSPSPLPSPLLSEQSMLPDPESDPTRPPPKRARPSISTPPQPPTLNSSRTKKPRANAKRERKAARRAARIQGGEGGMVIDDFDLAEAVEFTFRVGSGEGW